MNTFFIGIDCLALPGHYSGAGYFMYYLVRALGRVPRPFRLKVFCKPRHAPLLQAVLAPHDELVVVPLRNRAHLLAYYELALPRKLSQEKVALFHATHYLTPPARSHYRLITTVHDMGFFLFPDKYPFAKRLYFRKRFRAFLERADRIWTVSHSTRRSVQQFFPEFHWKLVTIYPGVDHLDEVEVCPHLRMEKPYLLSVNTIEVRKNIQFLIRVFNRLKKEFIPDLRLVIVGYPANGYRRVQRAYRASPYREDIQFLMGISLPELKTLYRNALCFVSASEYEGFGFTPFEAIREGIPAFLFQNNTVSEILGSHPYHFAHLDETYWAVSMGRAYQQGLPERGRCSRIAHLTWRETAHRAVQLYGSVLVGNWEHSLVEAEAKPQMTPF